MVERLAVDIDYLARIFLLGNKMKRERMRAVTLAAEPGRSPVRFWEGGFSILENSSRSLYSIITILLNETAEEY